MPRCTISLQPCDAGGPGRVFVRSGNAPARLNMAGGSGTETQTLQPRRQAGAQAVSATRAQAGIDAALHKERAIVMDGKDSTLKLGDQEVNLPYKEGTIGPGVVDIFEALRPDRRFHL